MSAIVATVKGKYAPKFGKVYHSTILQHGAFVYTGPSYDSALEKYKELGVFTIFRLKFRPKNSNAKGIVHRTMLR